MLKMNQIYIVICFLCTVYTRKIAFKESEILKNIQDSRQHFDSFFQLSSSEEENSKKNVEADATNNIQTAFNDQQGSNDEMEATVENVEDYFLNINTTGKIDRNDAVTPEYIPGLSLPISHRKETLQDIYIRERLPEIQKVIASGNPDEIARIIAESNDDPFTVLPNNLKYSDLLAADLFFSFLTKMVTWFVLISLLLPALVPMFTFLSLGAELAALWLIPDPSQQS